jgi:Flp pilus assembly protein TadD
VGVEKLKTGNRDGAIERFREALALAADNPHAHYQLALALGRSAPDEARRHFEDARRLAPYLRPPGTSAADCTTPSKAGHRR